MFKRHTPLAVGLVCLGLVLPGPLWAQSLDEMLVSGNLPDDARFAPGELTLGPTLSDALEEASAETLLDNREHGFCIAKAGADVDVFALARGNQMGIRLKCGSNAAAGLIYPTALRSRGLGLAFGVGRVGSVLGPLLGARLIGIKLSLMTMLAVVAGPVLLGDLRVPGLGKLKYEIGYLFGITGSTPQGTLRGLLEYEFHF